MAASNVLARLPRWPVALTVAGSDSGGGAGVQADLKTFAALRVHGTSAITCLTAQNPREVRAIHAAPAQFVRAQLETLFAELPPAGAKTGMLFSRAIIREIAAFWRAHPEVPLVVDPVMVSSSGARLLKPDAIQSLIDELLPCAHIVTPNLDETEILLGHPVRSIVQLRQAAREIHGRFGCAALVKGGHLRTRTEAIDFFFDGRTELFLSAPRVGGRATHGTGCTYSAAIAAFLARGLRLPEAVRRAKRVITRAIADSRAIGRHAVLNP